MSRRIKAWATGVASRQGPWVEVGIPLAAVFGLTVLAHGLLIPWLGFYWDDLPKSWFLHLFGPMGFWKVYQVDRPFLPWIYMLTTPILGVTPLGWQILGLLARAAAASAVWWLMRILWPDRVRLALLAALFFVVYPGFMQGPISLIYSHYFLLYGLFLVSLASSVIALRRPADWVAWTALSLTAQILVLFAFEYLIGLELVRPMVIGLALWQGSVRGSALVKRLLRSWLPYAIVYVAYLLWRALVVGFPTYEPELLETIDSGQLPELGGLLGRMAVDLYTASIGSWVHALRPPDLSIVGRTGVAAMIVAGVGALLAVGWALSRLRASTGSIQHKTRSVDLLQGILLGGWALLVAGLPVWVTLLPLRLVFPFDRLTLPFMFGSSVLLASAMLFFFGDRRIGTGIAAILIALGASFHSATAMGYVRDWQMFNSFIAQLTERVPGLKPGTTLLMDAVPFKYITDNSLTAPINWLLAPDLRTGDMPYLAVSIPLRLGGSLRSLEPDTPIANQYRATTFSGSTSQAIVVVYQPYDCLQVLDPALHADYPRLDEQMASALPLSRLELIDTEADRSPKAPFLLRAQPNWCTLFQQADLARQRGEWGRVAELGDIALGGIDKPNHGSELIPYIEGYARVGRWDDALDLTQAGLKLDQDIASMLCRAWERIESGTIDGPAREDALKSARSLAECEDSSQ